MNKRVREIIKMHLDTGLIELHTPITIMDLSAGEEVAACFTNRQMMKYLDREVYGYRINDRHGLQIVIKRQEGSLKEVEVHLSETEPPDPAELLMDLVEKAQMQQTIFTVLKALDEWEYPYESVTNAKNELRAAADTLGTEMDEIQKTVDEINEEKE